MNRDVLFYFFLGLIGMLAFWYTTNEHIRPKQVTVIECYTTRDNICDVTVDGEPDSWYLKRDQWREYNAKTGQTFTVKKDEISGGSLLLLIIGLLLFNQAHVRWKKKEKQ